MTDDLPRIDEATRPTWDPSPSVMEGDRGDGMGELLLRIHRHLRDEFQFLFRTLEDAVAHRGSAETAKPLVQRLSRSMNYVALGTLCSGYCSMLAMHHSIEDRSIFPELGKIEPSMTPVLKQLHAEHEIIAQIIDRLNASLELSTDRHGHRGRGERHRGGPGSAALVAPGLRGARAGSRPERLRKPPVGARRRRPAPSARVRHPTPPAVRARAGDAARVGDRCRAPYLIGMIVDPGVQSYIDSLEGEADPVLSAMESLAERKRFPIIGHHAGCLLAMLTRCIGARRVLELGSGYGYSAVWFARALPG